MAVKKFTFKTIQPTGKWRAFQEAQHEIKLNKKYVGALYQVDAFGDWKIRFMVYKQDINEDGNPNCSWKWITLTARLPTLEAAKKWVNDNAAAIQAKYNLRQDSN